MVDPNEVAEAYLAVWNEPDATSRLARLAGGWTADARYADPLMAATGQEPIAAMIAGAREQFPGHSFTLAGSPDGHGRFVPFSWKLAHGSGSAPVAQGTDIVRLNAAGHIAEVIGFLDGHAA